jgi:hypothetical protein
MKIDKSRNNKATVNLTLLGSLRAVDLFADSRNTATREGYVGQTIDVPAGIEEATTAKNEIVHLVSLVSICFDFLIRHSFDEIGANCLNKKLHLPLEVNNYGSVTRAGRLARSPVG